MRIWGSELDFPTTHHVPLLVVLVFDDEYHVKAGQDGGHEVNVVLPLCVIPAAKHRVGRSQYRAARVQRGGDASLREGKVLFCFIDKEKNIYFLGFFF